MTITKLKIAGVALVLASVSVPLLVQQRAIVRLNAELRQLRAGPKSSEGLTNSRPLQASVDPADLERLKWEHLELMRLRGEVGVRKRQVEELKGRLDLATSSERNRLADERQQEDGRYFAAETWGNLGFGEPQTAAVTFFWALRNSDQVGYSGAMAKVMPAPPDDWAEAFKSVKGSFLSPPEPQPNGDMKVSAAHELSNGEIVNTVLTYRKENGEWLVRQLGGFPIVLVEARSGTASYGIPAKQ